ncbi:MAG TPA: hypothetical protein VF629_09325 [Hymenobacter sp.]|jgi:hypothetical protein|uniref:hypothetical protein n=1 Tax=Hymenobacter sp. TaxID=1898978 RepID=UPI002ED99491
MSAQQITSVNAAQSHLKRTVNQVAQLTREEAWRLNSDAQLRRRMEALPYANYNANRMPASAKVDVMDESGTAMGQERYVVGQLWVFASTVNDAFGTRKYWVYNTRTGVLVSFEPERGIAAKNRSYMSEKGQFQNIAAGTGVVGGYLEKGFLGITAGALTGGLIYEVGGAAAVGTVIRAYVVNAAKGAALRGAIDLIAQFGVGAVTGKGSISERSRASFQDVNWTSVGGAAAVNTQGLKWCAKLLVAFGSSAATNFYTLKKSNSRNYGSLGHAVNFNDEVQSKEFVINLILGTAFDQVKEYGAPWLEKIMRNTPHAAGMLTALRHHRVVPSPTVKTVDQTMVAVLGFEMGAMLETAKKLWESQQAGQTPAAKKVVPTTRPSAQFNH